MRVAVRKRVEWVVRLGTTGRPTAKTPGCSPIKFSGLLKQIRKGAQRPTRVLVPGKSSQSKQFKSDPISNRINQSISQSISLQSVSRSSKESPSLPERLAISPLGPFFEVLRVRSFELVFVTNSSLLVNSLLEYTEFNHQVLRWNLTLATRSKSEDRTKRNTMLVHGKA